LAFMGLVAVCLLQTHCTIRTNDVGMLSVLPYSFIAHFTGTHAQQAPVFILLAINKRGSEILGVDDGSFQVLDYK